MENRNKRTIYISNLPDTVTEEDLRTIFENFGVCTSCELSIENLSAYIEFENEMSVDKALDMNNVVMGSNQVQVVLAYKDQDIIEKPCSYILSSKKVDYTNGVQIFVGDVGFHVDENMLIEGFSKFGKIIDVKVARMADGKHRGYAFISFSHESEADCAIKEMHNTMFHNRKIKCNWATKNKHTVDNNVSRSKYQSRPQLIKTIEEICYETPESNTSVYVTGENLYEEVIRPCFERFGSIKNIKAFPEKNHAFVNYDSHDSAAYAIQQLNGYTLENTVLKCTWGKKSTVVKDETEKIVDQYSTNQQIFDQSQCSQYYDNVQSQQYYHNAPAPQYYQNVPSQQFYNSSQSQPFYNNGPAQSYPYLNQMQQYYQNNFQSPQYQQQFYSHSHPADFYNNIQMQNYLQYQNNFNAQDQNFVSSQSYAYHK